MNKEGFIINENTFLIIILVVLVFAIHLLSKNKKTDTEIIETFKDSMNKVNSMNDVLDKLNDKETETRMFCRLLRHDDDKKQTQDLMDNRVKTFQNNWTKQNKLIADIKKKIIGLNLDNDSLNFMKFNNDKNKHNEELRKRKLILENAKYLLEKPSNFKININNNVT